MVLIRKKVVMVAILGLQNDSELKANYPPSQFCEKVLYLLTCLKYNCFTLMYHSFK